MNASDERRGEDNAGMDGIILSPGMLTALFAEGLVPMPALAPLPEPEKKTSPPPAAVMPEAAPVVSLGKNRRHICLLVSVPGKEVLPAKTLAFLDKILVACQLATDDLAIVNIRLSPLTLQQIGTRFSPRKWLIAGISPSSLGMDQPGTHFEVMPWQGAELLLLPALADIDQESAQARQLKRQLWAGLQKLFGL